MAVEGTRPPGPGVTVAMVQTDRTVAEALAGSRGEVGVVDPSLDVHHLVLRKSVELPRRMVTEVSLLLSVDRSTGVSKKLGRSFLSASRCMDDSPSPTPRSCPLTTYFDPNGPTTTSQLHIYSSIQPIPLCSLRIWETRLQRCLGLNLSTAVD